MTAGGGITPERGTCAFGCGPDESDAYVGGPGFGIVPACPVHGWICVLLDAARDERDRYQEALRIAGDVLMVAGEYIVSIAPEVTTKRPDVQAKIEEALAQVLALVVKEKPE